MGFAQRYALFDASKIDGLVFVKNRTE